MKRRYKNNLEKLIDSMQTIEKLIEKNRLNVMVKEDSVIAFISLPLHLSMTDNPARSSGWFYRMLGRMGIYRTNRRYVAMMYRVLHYANYLRGLNGQTIYWKQVYILVSNMEENNVLLHGFFNPENGGDVHFDVKLEGI